MPSHATPTPPTPRRWATTRLSTRRLLAITAISAVVLSGVCPGGPQPGWHVPVLGYRVGLCRNDGEAARHLPPVAAWQAGAWHRTARGQLAWGVEWTAGRAVRVWSGRAWGEVW